MIVLRSVEGVRAMSVSGVPSSVRTMCEKRRGLNEVCVISV